MIRHHRELAALPVDGGRGVGFEDWQERKHAFAAKLTLIHRQQLDRFATGAKTALVLLECR